jgi:ferredoxin
MEIVIDESRCIAAGNCVMVSDELFDQRDEDGVVIVLDTSPEAEALKEKAREAASVCPSQVITIVE